eukprot:scaffold8630_cov115-Isochrysis_galbana.AAC.1
MLAGREGSPPKILSQVIAKPSARRRLRDDLWTYWRGSDAVPEFPLTRSDVWTITEEPRTVPHVCMPVCLCLWESVLWPTVEFGFWVGYAAAAVVANYSTVELGDHKKNRFRSPRIKTYNSI